MQFHECKFLLQSCLTLYNPMDFSLKAPLSMGILQARHWSGLPYPTPGDLPNPEIKPRALSLQANSLPAEPQGKPIVSMLCH